jgi:phosphoribosylformylglycinamidine synthase
LPTKIEKSVLTDFFVVPRRNGNSLSTNAVEITQNMAISGIIRIEEFHYASADTEDPCFPLKNIPS